MLVLTRQHKTEYRQTDRHPDRDKARALTNNNHQMFLALAEEMVEELPHNRHGQVLEGPRAAMEQLKDVETSRQVHNGGDFRCVKSRQCFVHKLCNIFLSCDGQ